LHGLSVKDLLKRWFLVVYGPTLLQPVAVESTLHELEALQTKRAGGAAPLARLDVQGLES
jgi:hypothetical protein